MLSDEQADENKSIPVAHTYNKSLGYNLGVVNNPRLISSFGRDDFRWLTVLTPVRTAHHDDGILADRVARRARRRRRGRAAHTAVTIDETGHACAHLWKRAMQALSATQGFKYNFFENKFENRNTTHACPNTTQLLRMHSFVDAVYSRTSSSSCRAETCECESRARHACD